MPGPHPVIPSGEKASPDQVTARPHPVTPSGDAEPPDRVMPAGTAAAPRLPAWSGCLSPLRRPWLPALPAMLSPELPRFPGWQLTAPCQQRRLLTHRLPLDHLEVVVPVAGAQPAESQRPAGGGIDQPPAWVASHRLQRNASNADARRLGRRDRRTGSRLSRPTASRQAWHSKDRSREGGWSHREIRHTNSKAVLYPHERQTEKLWLAWRSTWPSLYTEPMKRLETRNRGARIALGWSS